MRNTAVIVNEGMRYLLEKISSLETEVFVSHLIREPAVANATDDYTKWRRDNLYTNCRCTN
jgi:hypothetical protein